MSKKNLAMTVIAVWSVLFCSLAIADDLDSVLKGIKLRYGSIEDLKAGFHQETMVKTLGRPQTKSGTVMFKRPDMMRWDYTAPNEQRLITDGYSLWLYQPEDKVVFLRRLDSMNSAKVPMQILSGDIDVAKVFDAKLGEKTDGLISVRLKPKEKGAGYEKAVLYLTADKYEISRIDVIDFYGNVTKLTLSNIQYNNKLKSSEFVYSPIPGVRVESEPVIE